MMASKRYLQAVFFFNDPVAWVGMQFVALICFDADDIAEGLPDVGSTCGCMEGLPPW